MSRFTSTIRCRNRRWREELRARPQREANRLAEIVENAFLHFDEQQYVLHAWCVMPNHVHTLFTPREVNMSQIVHSWKSFTAHECNKALGRTGRFWAREPFDRYIRSQRHFRNALTYIENNPVKAGLCEKPEDWRWSSARKRLGTHASGVLDAMMCT